jgi:hypothetical protein
MVVFYSPSVRGFFSPDGRPPIPSDAVEISDEQHANLIAGQTTGHEIVPGENGFPARVSPPVPTPEQTLAAWRATAKVSRFQAMAALSAAGKLTAATAAVNAAGGLAKLAWDNAIEFRRDSLTIAGLAEAVGLDDAAVDALFIAAAEIEA